MNAYVDHMSLAVTDVDAGIVFFARAFGFSVSFVERGMRSQIASMLGIADAECDLVQLKPPNGGPVLELIAFRHADAGQASAVPTVPGMGHIALKVNDFDAALTTLAALDATPLGQVTQFSSGRAVYLATTFGAFLEIQEAPRVSPSRTAESF